MWLRQDFLRVSFALMASHSFVDSTGCACLRSLSVSGMEPLPTKSKHVQKHGTWTWTRIWWNPYLEYLHRLSIGLINKNFFRGHGPVPSRILGGRWSAQRMCITIETRGSVCSTRRGDLVWCQSRTVLIPSGGAMRSSVGFLHRAFFSRGQDMCPFLWTMLESCIGE